jgi:undecaprenyl-phosphate 4-deoxy-4-formamido-L-arabinose transferase
MPYGTATLSVVIPVYNSAATLDALLARLVPVLDQVSAVHEIILVNDGSRDMSWECIVGLAERYSQVRGINLMRNYGQHNALLCGIRAAQHDVVVTMDDDLQHPPEEIDTLIAKLGEGFDVVYGRPARAQHGLWRNLASGATKLVLQSSMGADTARDISAFRAFRAPLRAAFATYQSPFVSIDVLLTWATTSFATVPVHHDPRRDRSSNYTFGSLLTHALSMMTGFSTLPLRIASILGFASTLFGLLVLVYVVGRFLLEGGSVAGFPFLASIIAIFSGVQLFSLGVIGEYLARMHFRSMERPTYAVRDRVGFRHG